MLVKRKTPKKVARRALKKSLTSSPSLEELAKKKMPKWRVAEEDVEDSPGTPEVDAVSPKLFDFRSQSFAVRSGMPQATTVSSEPDAKPKSSGTKRSGLVKMLPESDQDARQGAKTQVFEDDEHTGSQG